MANAKTTGADQKAKSDAAEKAKAEADAAEKAKAEADAAQKAKAEVAAAEKASGWVTKAHVRRNGKRLRIGSPINPSEDELEGLLAADAIERG